MIVCPECRHGNEEGVEYCVRCGRALAPSAALLMPRRTATPPQDVDEPAPRRPSKARAWVVLGVAVALVAGAGVWALVRPDPCRGTNFTSKHFGYCLTVPEGWTAEPARFGSSVELDQFTPQTQGTTVIVEAVDLTKAMDLGAFATFVRQKDQQAGLDPGTGSTTRLDGVDAQQWDISAKSADGTAYQLREVVVVKDQVGWRITLNDLAGEFDQHSGSFSRMLQSWRFR